MRLHSVIIQANAWLFYYSASVFLTFVVEVSLIDVCVLCHVGVREAQQLKQICFSWPLSNFLNLIVVIRCILVHSL